MRKRDFLDSKTKCEGASEKGLGWCPEIQALAWSLVQQFKCRVNLFLIDTPEIQAFRKALAQQAVGVFVGAALPW